MTPKERRAYMLKWHKFQQKYEIAFTDKFTNALQIQVKAYISSQDITAIPSFPIYDVLTKLYKSIGVAWAKEVKLNLSKADGQMGFSERIVELMRQYYSIDLLNDAELMTRYSREVIMQVLSRAAESGAQYSDIVEELLAHPEFNRSRAMRIARTETVTAANGAASLYARESGLQLDKTWIAIRDNRTRHTHMDVDTTPIPMDQPFIVGGSQMMQPGARMQPNGLPVPAKEIVNCRCTVGYIPKRDNNGRLIRR
jgi:hypothetical protein